MGNQQIIKNAFLSFNAMNNAGYALQKQKNNNVIFSFIVL